MEVIISTFVILIVVAIAQLISRFIPQFPNNYISLILGIIVAIIPNINHYILEFNNEIFMLFILVPLLFYEGQKTPFVYLIPKLKSILGTSFILVIISAIIVSFIISIAFGIAISLALVLVAISTPTDITAFESVTEGRKFPSGVEEQLKGEALFNDATGIILLQAAVLWFTTKELSITHSILELIYSATVGIIIGVILSLILIIIRRGLVNASKNQFVFQILTYLFSPFIIYIIAEEIHVSGIIAVVVAGIVHSSELHRSRFSAPRQVHFGIQIVNLSSTVLNSFVFVSLGISLERIIVTQENVWSNSIKWFLTGLTIYCALVCVRFIYGKIFVGNKNLRDAFLFSIGGVHGAITLAMTFSVSNMFNDQVFSYLIIIESLVIIMSILIPTILFKFILPKDYSKHEKRKVLKNLRTKMTQVGINEVESMILPNSVKEIVIFDLKDQDSKNTLSSFFTQIFIFNHSYEMLSNIQSVEHRRALMHAFKAQQNYLYQLAKDNSVKSEYVYELFSEILLSQSLVLDPKNQMH